MISNIANEVDIWKSRDKFSLSLRIRKKSPISVVQSHVSQTDDTIAQISV